MMSSMPRCGATPARSTDDLPLPDAPTTARNGWARRRVDDLIDDLLAPEEALGVLGGERQQAGVRALVRRRRRVHAGSGDGEDVLVPLHAAKAVGAQVHQGHTVGKVPLHQPGGGLRDMISPASPRPRSRAAMLSVGPT